MSYYPNDLIPILKKKCASLNKIRGHEPPNLPSDAELESLLDVAFQASFLTEEGRRLGFRIVYASKDEIGESINEEIEFFGSGTKAIPFDNPRPYSVSEINRVSPAAEFTRLMICVSNSKSAENPKLTIWGLLDVGANWWKFVHHESSGGRCPPSQITVTCYNPGELSLSSGGDIYCFFKKWSYCRTKT